jgi:hypothetical protein
MPYEQVREASLSPQILAELRKRQRIYEINAQVAVAVAKGTPLAILLDHPAGLMSDGSCKGHFLPEAEERAFIAQRYEALARLRARGKLDTHAFKRGLEDGGYTRWAVRAGVLVEVVPKAEA